MPPDGELSMAKLIIIPALLLAFVTLAFIPSDTIASHRSRGSRGVRAERGSRSHARSKRGESARGRRREHLSRAERRRGRREGYISARRGRRYEARRGGRYEPRRGHGRRIYYFEARESPATPTKPASTGIPTERVTEIQRALIKEGYLQGQASGQYDDTTIAAMKQFQTDNGFPASGLPSAHTLKKLGVTKRTNDGYAVPINSATEDQKRPSQTAPQVKKGKGSTGEGDQ